LKDKVGEYGLEMGRGWQGWSGSPRLGSQTESTFRRWIIHFTDRVPYAQFSCLINGRGNS